MPILECHWHWRVRDIQQQHTAAHCNTLQHTTTQYNTLQHTAIHCNTLPNNTIPFLNVVGDCMCVCEREIGWVGEWVCARKREQHTLGALSWRTLSVSTAHCNAMQQYTATHRNTLQHTAACWLRVLSIEERDQFVQHCQTLHQHAATTHYDTLQHTATHCNTLQPTATHCSMLTSGVLSWTVW